MSMSIGMSKDLDAYKEDVIPGMDTRESLYAITAVLFGAGIIGGFYLLFGLDIKYAIYMGTPFVAPIVFLGFGKTHGMHYDEVFLLYLKKRRSPKTLLYVSTETESQVSSLLKEIENEKKQSSAFGMPTEDMKKMKIRILFIFAVFIMLLFAAGIILMYL